MNNEVRSSSKNLKGSSRLSCEKLGIRVTDPETARVVAVHAKSGGIIGAGCLISADTVLTCLHVVRKAIEESSRKPQRGDHVSLSLVGIATKERFDAVVQKAGNDEIGVEDIALLKLQPNPKVELKIPPVEFATPLRHSGKCFSVLGFPSKSAGQGRNVVGTMHAADAAGLVQMDSGGKLEVEGGFSGAPVWSQDLGAFVGIVVTELKEREVSWCIPSRILCDFYNDLAVRFRVPPPDRPHIHDYEVDDPNLQLFGSVSDNGSRKLEARVTRKSDYFNVELTYSCHKGSRRPKGRYVTFITYPDFEKAHQDAYELFSLLDSNNIATNEIYPNDLFSVAAIGDAGDTALTLDLATIESNHRRRKQ